MSNFFQRLDRAIATTLMLRGWSITAGLVMMLLVGLRFSKIEQGYYYTFSSVLALQVFFELGLNLVLLQFVSHEAAKLNEVHGHADLTANKAADRIASLLATIRSIFKWLAASFTVMVGAGGFAFLSLKGAAESPAGWPSAWLMLCVFTGVNLYFSPQLAVAEGLGMVSQVAVLRLVQSLLGFFICWSILLVKPSLFAAVAMPAAAATGTAFWLARYSGLKKLMGRAKIIQARVDWKTEIFPMQWRIALSWVSGYLIFQLFTPAVFAAQGAVAAGQLGLSLAVFVSITNLSMSWINAKVPMFGHFIASGEGSKLRSLFRQLLLRSTIACVITTFIAVTGIITLHSLKFSIAERFLPWHQLSILALIAILNHVVFAMASFMRAHKEEPMLLNSIICGLAVLTCTVITAPIGVFWVIIGYFSVCLFLSLPWTLILFNRYWRRIA